MAWVGWSTDQDQADETRVLAGLLDSVEAGQTQKSAQSLIEELGISSVESHQFVTRLIRTDGIFLDETTAAPGLDTLILGPHSRDVIDQFRDARTRKGLTQGARSALLNWLYDQADRSHFAMISAIRTSPHRWFYGQEFSAAQISEAAQNLKDRNLVDSIGSWQDPVLRARLTALGVRCVESYHSNPDEMETSMTGAGNVNIGTFNQSGGNNAFASTVGSQSLTTNTLTIGQTAKDLVALLQVVREQGGIPEDEIEEADDIENALLAGAEGSEQQATEAVGRARRFFQRLGKMAEPATQALFAAAGNYAALRLGLAQ